MKLCKIAFPYLLFAFMIGLVFWSNVRERPQSQVTSAESIRIMAALRSTAPERTPPYDATTCHYCGKKIRFNAVVADAPADQNIRFCSIACKEGYLRKRLHSLGQNRARKTRDPVCGMEVNPAWGISYQYSGVNFPFCTEMCRNAFAAAPLSYLVERCMVCRKPVITAKAFPGTYLGKTYYLCSPEHRQEFKADPAKYFMHRMWGIPDWLYYISIALVLLVSFLMFEGVSALAKNRPSVTPAGKSGDRINILQLSLVRGLLCSRPVRFFFQLIIVGFFILIIAAGLFGNQNPALNLAPLLTWTIWWCGLVVVIMFAGKAWCYMCPWDAIASWMEKLHFWKKTDSGIGLGLPWPRILQNIAIATVLFVALTWIELGFNVTMRPVFTAYLAIGMLVLAIVSAFLFDRKSFCRYGCLVGRVSGLYALFSGIEIRRKHAAVCAACNGRECSSGSAQTYGCPTFEFPAHMVTNTYCIQCTECLQSCPHNNLAVNLRPWGEDLKVEGKTRTDEAYMALLMLAITGFHGLTMTPVWADLTGLMESLLPFGRIGAFSMGMAMVMGFPLVLYAFFVWLSRTAAATADPAVRGRFSYHDYFVRYAYCLLPIALFYHLAHNLEHLLMEGPKIVSLMSDPFGWGWNLLGTAGITIPPLTSLDVLWILQVILVGVGHVYSLWAAQKITKHVFANTIAGRRGQWPMLAVMIVFSVFSLWLLKQPMEMRTSAM